MGRYALIVATSEYAASEFRQMRSPAQDADGLSRVLSNPAIGGFDQVTVLRNEVRHQVEETLVELLSERARDDLVLIYFTCHGVKDVYGRLFFATSNTRPDRLPSTAVSAAFVNEQIQHCAAESKVVLLDCCYSGAFAAGFEAKASGDVAVDQQLSGSGTVIIASSGALEYAFEGDRVSDPQRPPSIFTDAVIEGLRTGAADLDRDGWITVHELYTYVYDIVRDRAPQTPTYLSRVEGTVYLARTPSTVLDDFSLSSSSAAAPAEAVPPISPTSLVSASDRERRTARWRRRVARLLGGRTPPSLAERMIARHPVKNALFTAGASLAIATSIMFLLRIWFGMGSVRATLIWLACIGLFWFVNRLSINFGQRWRHRYIGLYKAGFVDPVGYSEKRVLLPIGHFVAVHPDTGAASSSWYCEVRTGTTFHHLTQQEHLLWWLAHGTPSEWGALPHDRASLSTSSVLTDAARTIDRMISLGLLVELERGTKDVTGFARRHRFVPLQMGLGNTTGTPWLHRIGGPDRTTVEVHPSIYRLFLAAPLYPSLWDACTAVALDEAPLQLDLFVQGLPALLAAHAGHLDLVVDTRVGEGNQP